MYWERDVQVKQEQMKDIMRQREEDRLLVAVQKQKRRKQLWSHWLEAVTAVRTLRQKLMPGVVGSKARNWSA
jgi:hypothetical protein